MPFTMPSFPLMSLTQASPVAAAMQTALMGQRARQAGIESQYMPQQLQAALMQQQQRALQEQQRTQFMPQLLAAQTQAGSPLGRALIALAQHFDPQIFAAPAPTAPAAPTAAKGMQLTEQQVLGLPKVQIGGRSLRFDSTTGQYYPDPQGAQ